MDKTPISRRSGREFRVANHYGPGRKWRTIKINPREPWTWAQVFSWGWGWRGLKEWGEMGRWVRRGAGYRTGEKEVGRFAGGFSRDEFHTREILETRVPGIFAMAWALHKRYRHRIRKLVRRADERYYRDIVEILAVDSRHCRHVRQEDLDSVSLGGICRGCTAAYTRAAEYARRIMCVYYCQGNVKSQYDWISQRRTGKAKAQL